MPGSLVILEFEIHDQAKKKKRRKREGEKEEERHGSNIYLNILELRYGFIIHVVQEPDELATRLQT